MKRLRSLPRHWQVLVVFFLVFASAGLIMGAVVALSPSPYERALAQSDDLLLNDRMTSLEVLIGRFVEYQFGDMFPPLPGTEPWEQAVGVFPADFENFPQEFKDGLIGYLEAGVPVYEISMFQDQASRELVWVNSDGVEFYAMPCPASYDVYCMAKVYALYLRPDLYSGKYTKQEIEDFIAWRDPARMGIRFTLTPSTDLFTLLYARESNQSVVQQFLTVFGGGGGSQMMMSMGGGSGPLNDLDNDGVPNRDEIMAGTDPEDANDFLRITNMLEIAGSREIMWPAVSNRDYSVLTATGGMALFSPQDWTVATQWLSGADSGLVFTDTVSSAEVAFHHIQVRETDSNSNGIPDWWEYENFGGPTNITATGDEDGDGLNNLEEVYYGYDPQKSERELYHSIFKTVCVSNGVPLSGADDGTEFFDFHGGGRPLSLASNAVDGFGVIAGDNFSGGIFFNSDMSNLYVGISGVKLAGPHAVAVFIDATTGGETDLSGLSGAPHGFGQANNITFASGFTPEVGLLVGGRYGDGRNYESFEFRGDQSWAMYASTGHFAAAEREFKTPMAVNQSFGIDLDNGYLETGYAVGVELKNASDENRIGFIFRGGDSKYKIQDNGGEKEIGLDWSPEGIRLQITLTAANTYTLSALRLVDGTTFTTNGTLGATSGSTITKMRVYNGGTGSGTNFDLYVNNLRIGPHFDSASDPAYSGGWDANAASGSGFSNWTLTESSTNFAGHFLGRSTNNAAQANTNSDLDIETINDMGQGAWYLSDNSSFSGFSTSSGSPISQWARNWSGDNESAHAGIEVALSLDSLGANPGDTIKVALVFLGDSNGTNRWVSPEVYGSTVAPPTNWGYDEITIGGAELQLGSASQTLPPNTYPGFSDDDVLLQGFYWDVPVDTWWTNLTALAPDIATSGFTMVWLPPPYKAANQSFSVGYDPFDHYDLGEYDQGSGLTRTRYGTKAKLTNLIATLLATNVRPMCDIVLNHMAGGSGAGNKTFDYPHNTFEKSAGDFHPSSDGHNDELFPYHFNFLFGDTNAVPLDTAFLAPNMRLGYKAWGSWLVTNIHFSTFRFDFTEGIEPWFVWEWLNYPAQRDSFPFVEYWEKANGVEMHEWLELTGYRSAIYDWHLRDEYLRPMCEENGTFDMNELKSQSLLGRVPSHTVILVENHDTFRPNFDGKLGILKDKHMAYAYAMHSEGLPLVFYHDYYLQPYHNGVTNWGTPLKSRIDRLIEIRKKTVGGAVSVLSTNSDLYVQQRDGGMEKPGSILVLNDHASSTLTIQVQTVYTSEWLIDLVTTNAATLVQTSTNGTVILGAPARDYRIYGLTNSLSN